MLGYRGRVVAISLRVALSILKEGNVDLATIVGAVGGIALLIVVMLLSGSLAMYWDFLSIIVVIGGAFFATMMRWPIGNFFGGLYAGVFSVLNRVPDPIKLIDTIIELANTARKGSILALEKVQIEDKYLAKAVRYMVDGVNPEIINGILDLEIDGMNQRHKDGRGVYENLGDSAPAFGMIGTVIGLIVIMANLTDPSKIGPGLAVALVTTLYGALAANMFFMPIGQKLKFRADEEETNLNIIKEGVNAILNGENPRAIREKLESYLAPTRRNGGED